jgi:hypothetical protein
MEELQCLGDLTKNWTPFFVGKGFISSYLRELTFCNFIGVKSQLKFGGFQLAFFG